ncbi:MAG: lipoate--protein ligase family protein, partial [Puniceicoccaceae bacterium]
MLEVRPSHIMLIQLPNAFGDAATNMAIDAALLDCIPAGLATFRHYGWTEPAATFGYAQSYAEVRSALSAAPAVDAAPPVLVRRQTGGGIVDHRNDWTYALILHHSLPAAQRPATQIYQQIHQAISQTLQSIGIETQLAPCPRACHNPPPAPTRFAQHPVSRIPHPVS